MGALLVGWAYRENGGCPSTSPCSAQGKHTQTLRRLTKSLQSFRGIEKNLLAKKFIKSIIYSKESIGINIFYISDSRAPEREKARAKSTGEFRKYNNGSPGRLNSNYIIPIIIPNTIHACKRKNL